MSTKKVCSLGILDININLVLRKSQADNFCFDINSYNKVEDLENLFFPERTLDKYSTKNENVKSLKINYFDYISLSSDNNLINTLLYINRAYKTKTFIEFIMLNQIEFSHSTKFVRKILQEILDRNYFFIIENKILDIPSKIKFTIKILNNIDDQIISMKSFELFEINDLEIKSNLIKRRNEDMNSVKSNVENNNNLFFEYNNNYIPVLNMDKIIYNFEKTDFFLLDMNTIKDFKLLNNKDFSIFLFEIIKKYPLIKIVLIVDDNINNIEKENLKLNKQLIELSDIIFSFQDKINNFFKIYNSSIKSESKELKYYLSNLNEYSNFIGNQRPRIYDLIIEDRDKCRKNIPRTTIIFEEFNNVTIYKQLGINMKLDYVETYHITTSLTKNVNKLQYLYCNNNLFYHIFIGGFLSRMIYNKSFRVCVGAGDLLIKKNIRLFMKNIDYINDLDKYNVLVPSIRKNKKLRINEKIIKEHEELLHKENKFILDCTNLIKSQKKDYNPLYDENCASYLLKNQNMKHLKEVGFINKNGVILKDPDIIRTTDKNKNLIKNMIKARILTDKNIFVRNHKNGFRKTIYNTINALNYDSSEENQKFKSIFNHTNGNSFHRKNDSLSPKYNTFYYLPKMSKTLYNFSTKDTKKLIGLNKPNNKILNINKISKTPRNSSFNSGKGRNKNDLIIMYKNTHTNYSGFPKLFKKGNSKK